MEQRGEKEPRIRGLRGGRGERKGQDSESSKALLFQISQTVPKSVDLPPSPSYEASEVSRTMRYTAAQFSMFWVPVSVDAPQAHMLIDFLDAK